MPRIVTMTTDFGLKDPFVGIMKGVILGICPDAQIVDITHDIPPQDVLEACYTLYAAYKYFPKDAVHVVVVDPGVGTDRRVLYAVTGSGMFLAPNNGVLSLVLGEEETCEIRCVTNERFFRKRVSSTFHGRDIFAPVAGHILNGTPAKEFGKQVKKPNLIEFPEPHRVGTTLVGEVFHIDRFGNLVTNIREYDLAGEDPKKVTVRIGKTVIKGLHKAYCDVQHGNLVALIGSSWHLEIAMNGGSAESALRVGKGDDVEVNHSNS